jgi:cullin 1
MERSKLEKDVVLNYISDIVKHKILIHENDNYVYNENFDNENDYIVLIDLNKSETTIQEKEEVEERAIEERKYIVEAYIIKLLKPKKQMKLNDLITDVVNIVRFPCEEEFVKTHINILIDNGYISKDETNPELIRYSS